MRRAPAPRWLDAIGARPPGTAAVDRGFRYYTRYFAGPQRPRRIGRALVPIGSFSLITLAADNDTWSVTVFGLSGDAPLTALRDVDAFTRVVAACPLQAHWLDGRPLTDIVAMGGGLDRRYRHVVDGVPVVTGFAAVGDAWACTNPSAARGLSVGIVHGQVLRDAVRAHLDEPADFAAAFADATDRVVGPFHDHQVGADRQRVAEMDALREGRPVPVADSPMARLAAAAGRDADAFRGLIDTVVCLAQPEEVLDRPTVRAAVDEYGAGPPPAVPGPDRGRLLDLLAGRVPAGANTGGCHDHHFATRPRRRPAGAHRRPGRDGPR